MFSPPTAVQRWSIRLNYEYGPLTRDDLFRHCSQKLPRERQPDRVIILDALPKLGNGKTDRARLRTAQIQQQL